MLANLAGRLLARAIRSNRDDDLIEAVAAGREADLAETVGTHRRACAGTVVVEHEAIDGQARTSSMIRNYPGFISWPLTASRALRPR